MTARPTAAAFVARARGYLGTAENPPESNRQPFSAKLGRPPQPWCADFVVVCAREVGLTLPSESAYTPTMANGFRAAKRFGQEPRVGAVVFFEWPGMGRIAHVGIVEAILSDGRIATIEGNTDSKGGRTGGRVMRQTRRANIAGYGYPAFATATPAKPTPTPRPKPEPKPTPAQRGDRRMIVRFSDGPHVYEVVGSHLEHITAEAFEARGLTQADVVVHPPTHKLAKLPRTTAGG